jgi:hypothetical protein
MAVRRNVGITTGKEVLEVLPKVRLFCDRHGAAVFDVVEKCASSHQVSAWGFLGICEGGSSLLQSEGKEV